MYPWETLSMDLIKFELLYKSSLTEINLSLWIGSSCQKTAKLCNLSIISLVLRGLQLLLKKDVSVPLVQYCNYKVP